MRDSAIPDGLEGICEPFGQSLVGTDFDAIAGPRAVPREVVEHYDLFVEEPQITSRHQQIGG